MASPYFSIIIPLYNRPQEIHELLLSLCIQTFKDFEVLVIEDGSTAKAESVLVDFYNKLNIRYYYKPNSGQGFSRNYGFQRAEGSYFIIFDSDVVVPEQYLSVVYHHILVESLDAYGGPDAAHPSFTPIQKAINYAMTSVFTTGGIRGGNQKIIKNFHPRSFNMGLSRRVYEKSKGFILTRLGEDIEFSIRVQSLGFRTALIPEAYVYHKRRTSLLQFFRQVHFFGRARINIFKFYPKELKWIHFMPAAITGLIATVLLAFLLLWFTVFNIGILILTAFTILVWVDATYRNRSLWIGTLSVATSYIQLVGYGIGFLTDFFKMIVDWLVKKFFNPQPA